MAPYDTMHVQRGDKLLPDECRLLRLYRTKRGMHDKATGGMPADYIPLRHYLAQYKNIRRALTD
jgi:hypothetical protein